MRRYYAFYTQNPNLGPFFPDSSSDPAFYIGHQFKQQLNEIINQAAMVYIQYVRANDAFLCPYRPTDAGPPPETAIGWPDGYEPISGIGLALTSLFHGLVTKDKLSTPPIYLNTPDRPMQFQNDPDAKHKFAIR